MKSNAPWSVKGIERDARETAKEAARREGMTVGEWLNQVIYTAGDPETSDGEIEGLKTSDLVAAIEHLNKRAIGAETKSAAAIEDLARNFAGFVERLQRVERARPSAGGVSADVEDRIARLEAKAGDRQRIDALKALEKAVGQVALQYDSAHRTSLTRIESVEKQLQQLASRLDEAGAAGGGADTGALTQLRETVEGLSARIARAERIAAEAAALKRDSADSTDADFVERTGARLRVLGDEIKRGGDQMRALEAAIKKLSDQIDAAEKRSSDGVRKVAETVSELRAQVGAGAAPGAAQRAEDKVAALQRSFEAMIAKLQASGAAPLGGEFTTGPIADAADALNEIPDPAASAVETAAHDEDEDQDETFSSFDLDDEIAAQDEAESLADPDNEPDDFEFDLDDDDGAAPESAVAARSESEDDWEDEENGQARRDDEDVEAPQDGLDAILAGFDDIENAATPARRAPDSSPDPADAEAEEEPAPAADDFLRAAQQRPARESDEAAERAGATRRTLSPRQRALLAAKIRRKRLAQASLADDPAPAADTLAAGDRGAGDEEEARPGLFARASGFFGAARARFSPRADREEPNGRERENEAARAALAGDEERAPEAVLSEPNILRAVRRAGGRLTAKPLTIALAIAVMLAAAALFFLVKDMIAGDPRPDPLASDAASPAQTVARSEPAEDARIVEEAPAAPETPLVQARTLYFDSVAQLKSAGGDAEARRAINGIEEAAALGHPPAQLQLGELYKLGQGVPQDLAQARAWYERAGTGGNLLAMHRAGVMAWRGQGGEIDQAAAIDWFKTAANLGLVDSQYNLGALYHPGVDGANASVQDAGEAYYWYSLARRNGDEQAGGLAESLLGNLSPDRRREIDARVAAWEAGTPDAEANEIAPAS